MKNIKQDINSRSTTLLGADWPSAEETVWVLIVISMKDEKNQKI